MIVKAIMISFFHIQDVHMEDRNMIDIRLVVKHLILFIDYLLREYTIWLIGSQDKDCLIDFQASITSLLSSLYSFRCLSMSCTSLMV